MFSCHFWEHSNTALTCLGDRHTAGTWSLLLKWTFGQRCPILFEAWHKSLLLVQWQRPLMLPKYPGAPWHFLAPNTYHLAREKGEGQSNKEIVRLFQAASFAVVTFEDSRVRWHKYKMEIGCPTRWGLARWKYCTEYRKLRCRSLSILKTSPKYGTYFFQVCYQNGAWISNFILFALTTFADLDLFVFCNFIYCINYSPNFGL